MKTDSLAIIERLTANNKNLSDSIQSLQFNQYKLSEKVNLLSQKLDNQLHVIDKAHDFYTIAWGVVILLVAAFAGALPIYLQKRSESKNDEMREALEKDISSMEKQSRKRTKKAKKKIKSDFEALENTLTTRFNKQEEKHQEIVSLSEMTINRSIEELMHKQTELADKNKLVFRYQLHHLQGLIFFKNSEYLLAIINAISGLEIGNKLESYHYIDFCLKNLIKSLQEATKQDIEKSYKGLNDAKDNGELRTFLISIKERYKDSDSIVENITKIQDSLKD